MHTQDEVAAPRRLAPSYGHVAWCYDALAQAWSAGRIDRAKLWTLSAVEPGHRILFAGAGCGRDVVEAARRGLQVTALDASPAMLGRLESRLARQGARAELIHGSIFAPQRFEPFDAVACHFFLNVFAGEDLVRAVHQVGSWIRPGGKLLVADFAVPPPSLPARLLHGLHYWPVALVGSALRLGALHGVHDYEPLLRSEGFVLQRQRSFPVLGGQLPAVAGWVYGTDGAPELA